jgi:hypothetical protein
MQVGSSDRKERNAAREMELSTLTLMLPRPTRTTHLSVLNLFRSFANQLPRPPPKPLPPPETFSSTARPRQYYSRPQPRDLPPYRVSSLPPFFFILPIDSMCSAHGPASSQFASAASARGQHSWPTPRTKSAFRALQCVAYSASCMRATTCAPPSAMRCAPSPSGISTAVRGCTVRYV